VAEEPKVPSPRPGTGAKPAPRVVGPIAPAVYTAGQKTGAYKPVAAPLTEPVMTEGMKARQRELEKKRRLLATLKQVEVEEQEDRWRRYRGWIFRFVAVLVALGIYWKIQSTYGNRWPLWTVWIFLGTLLVTALFWLFWYLDYSD
jgi:hypothetical protein